MAHSTAAISAYLANVEPARQLKRMSPTARVVHAMLDTYRAAKGLGPFWVAMLVNQSPKAKTKTAVVYHTDIRLFVDLKNRNEFGQSIWAIAAAVGPIEGEREAQGMVGAWLTTAKKEREARVMCARVMHYTYSPRYPGLTLYMAPLGSITVDDDILELHERDRLAAIYRKRARRSDNRNVKRRIHELSHPRTRYTLHGDVRARRITRDRQMAEEAAAKTTNKRSKK